MRNKQMEKWENSKFISSDDPKALEKLKVKLENLRKLQEYMKKANIYYRKYKTMKGFENLNDNEAEQWDYEIVNDCLGEKQPFRSYELQNNNANMRRVKTRIQDLEKRDESFLGTGWKFSGGSVVFNYDENRIQIFFDEKPEPSIRSALKEHGFIWAPSKSAWQRQLNKNGIYAVKQITVIQPK